MANYMLIEAGFVVNFIEAEPEFANAIGAIEMVAGAKIGCAYSEGICYPLPVKPPVVPESVTMRQARMALLGAGLLATVNAAVAAMAGTAGDAARIEWEYSTEVFRNRPLVLGLGQSLGLTTAQLDGLFIAAVAIK